jgi:hypothetical protein
MSSLEHKTSNYEKMKIPSFHRKIRPTEIATQIQVVIMGFVLGETWHFTQAIAFSLNSYISSSDQQGIALAASAASLIIILSYAYFRNVLSGIKWLWNSNRASLIGLGVLAMFGYSISAVVGGVGTSYYQELVAKVPSLQLILLVSIPLAIALLFILKTTVRRDRKNGSLPFFLNDQGIMSKEEDLLGVNTSAERFADRVLNGGSSDSLVFGIDAPWGIGKSSFINLCCEYWQHTTPPCPIVHRFEPLRYINTTNLVEKFIFELMDTIQENIFDPSIHSLLSKYLRMIKGKSEFSFLGFKFELESNSGAVDKTLETLKVRLGELDRKIIIVIDDLDRLSWAEVKSILYAIKQSFLLPNVSYVLCYDTENLASLKETYGEAEQVKEFLEKYVNVKIGLYLDSESLANLVSSNISDAINKNLQLDAHLLDQIKQALKALEEIYRSNDFVFYYPFLGDVRKLKRLINTMMLFEIQSTDFNNSDYNKRDLLHLLLVYINYPNIFRTIYNAETGGKNGFFSLILDETKTNMEFVNSPNYSKYLARLNNDNQQFLLNKIFSPNAPFDTKDSKSFGGEIDQAAKMSRACFNGQGYTGRNLEGYLNLIIKLSKQDKRESYRFYLSKKDALLQGNPLDSIFQGDEFSFSKGESARDQLWMIIANSAHEIGPDIGAQLVLHIINHLPDYSFFERENIGAGLRRRLIYSLLKLLDESVWGSGLTGRRNNTEENISEIAEWVFGEREHANTGVINTLVQPERGPLRFFDLLLFRLYCSADRGGSLFNLQRAIALHNNPTAPTSGITTEIAKEGMREISQVIFRIFKSQYIEPGINIFEAIENLSPDVFAGASAEYISEQIREKKITQEQIDELTATEKTHAKAFIIYQLGNSMISSGVGCGYYDETGNEDKHGIAARVNDYLFDQCFDPSKNPNNYKHFLDYLLINFSHTFDGADGFHHIPTIGEFTKVLHLGRLTEYWKSHRASVLSHDFPAQQRFVQTSSYTATYSRHLPAVYRVLDEVLQVE